MTISIFSSFYSPRLKFILDFLCHEFLHCDYFLYHDSQQYKEAKGPHLNYSTQRLIQPEIFIPAGPLLSEKGIQVQQIRVTKLNNLPFFFNQQISEADLSFDLFSMVFYLLSRYEEYLPFEADQHHRFPANKSLAFQAGFLHLPVVDLWLQQLQDIFTNKYPTFVFPQHEYTFLPTYDIDMAWAYLNKGTLRFWGALGKEVFKGGLNSIGERLMVKTGMQKDPFYTFSYMDKLHEKFHLNPLYFFLVGENGTYDKNSSINNKNYQKLIRQLSQTYSIGIHPSYQSNESINRLRKEKEQLDAVVGKKIKKSRQHFLKLSLPETYQNLLEVGIEKDFTMGYAEKIGFRASTSRPFYWYDLSKEKSTKLRIIPFAVMDVTLKQYLQLTPENVLTTLQPLIEITRKVKGTFSTLWHNNSLAEIEGWEGWKIVYEEILEAAAKK